MSGRAVIGHRRGRVENKSVASRSPSSENGTQPVLSTGAPCDLSKAPGESLQLVRREEQAGLRIGDALDGADAAERCVEGFETVGAKLGDDIPAAVGGVQGANLGVAAQGAKNGVGPIAFDADEHDGADAVCRGFGRGADREAEEDALADEAIDAVLDGGAGDGEALGEGRDGGSGVVAEEGDEFVVEGVHVG